MCRKVDFRRQSEPYVCISVLCVHALCVKAAVRGGLNEQIEGLNTF